MRFFNTIALATFVANVYALPVVAPPSLSHPKVHAFKGDAIEETLDLEPQVESRDVIATNIDGAEPGKEIRSEAAINTPDLEPKTQAGEESHYQARDETEIEVVDLDNHDIEARGLNPSDERKYRDNLAKLNAGNCGQGCLDSINSYLSKTSQASRASITPPARYNTAADKKYRDNLAKLDAGNCGQGCLDSINSYLSKTSQASRASITPPARYNTAADKKYRDNLAKLDAGNCGQGCLDSINSYLSKTSQASRASITSPDRHRTDADYKKYRDNLAKLDAGNCGQGCLDSIKSYLSKSS